MAQAVYTLAVSCHRIGMLGLLSTVLRQVPTWERNQHETLHLFFAGVIVAPLVVFGDELSHRTCQ